MPGCCLGRHWAFALVAIASIARTAVADDASAIGEGGQPDQQNVGYFESDGESYTLKDWGLFLSLSANDLVGFVASRHAKIKEELDGLDEGSFQMERARKRISKDPAFQAEFAKARADLRQAVFRADAKDAFGLQHLGGGHFFLYFAGGSREPYGPPIMQAAMPNHEQFSIINFRRYRRFVDHDGVTWGIDLKGMPKALAEIAEDNLPDGDGRWQLRWTWRGLARANRSWRVGSDQFGRPRREAVTVYTLTELAVEILDRDGKLLWTAR